MGNLLLFVNMLSSVMAATSQTSQAKAASQEKTDRAVTEIKARGKATRRRAASVKSSFLNSGFTLQGSPNASLDEIFDTGFEDIQQVSKNARTESKNILKAGRTAAIGGLATSAAGSLSSLEGLGDTVNPLSNTGGVGNFLNDVFNVPLSTGGGGSITGAGVPTPGIKPMGVGLGQ